MKKFLLMGLLICLSGCSGLHNNALMALRAAEIITGTPSYAPTYVYRNGYGYPIAGRRVIYPTRSVRTFNRIAAPLAVAGAIAASQPQAPVMATGTIRSAGKVTATKASGDRKRTVTNPSAPKLAMNNARY